jgi:hypothetical protein
VVRLPRNATAGDTVEFEVVGSSQFARIKVPWGARERQMVKVQVPRRAFGAPVLGACYRLRLWSGHRLGPSGAYLDLHRSMHKDARTPESTFALVRGHLHW